MLDRLSTYAQGSMLRPDQLNYLAAEGKPYTVQDISITLVKAFNNQIDNFLNDLYKVKEEDLLRTRGVGRTQIPSTVIGLLVHAAEHTTRHYGQLMVTVKVLKAQ